MILWDGSIVCFGELTLEELQTKYNLATSEGQIYRDIIAMLTPNEVQQEIKEKFPKQNANPVSYTHLTLPTICSV